MRLIRTAFTVIPLTLAFACASESTVGDQVVLPSNGSTTVAQMADSSETAESTVLGSLAPSAPPSMPDPASSAARTESNGNQTAQSSDERARARLLAEAWGYRPSAVEGIYLSADGRQALAADCAALKASQYADLAFMCLNS